MPKVTHVKKARKDYPEQGIKKGDAYYYWSFMTGGRGGPKIRSLSMPKPSQLTQSEFFQALYSIQEGLEAPSDAKDMESTRDDIISDLQNLLDETQGKLDNMPDGLRDGDSGQTLQTRVENVEQAINDLESIDCDIDDKPNDESEDDWKERVWDEIDSAVNNIEG